MIVSSSPPPPTLFLRVPSRASFRPFGVRVLGLGSKTLVRRTLGCRRRSPVCHADLSLDAPLAGAIGACIVNSLVFPVPAADGQDDDEGGGAIDTTDVMFGVMGVIGFIPYFNWLSWVFAWLDSGRKRYLVYAIVYLAPYLRTNLSISPEESWLPIASILLCMVHIHLEASIRNGDLDDFQLLREVQNLFGSKTRMVDNRFDSADGSPKGKKVHEELPSAHGTRDRVREWGNPKKPVDLEHGDGNFDVNAKEKKSE